MIGPLPPALDLTPGANALRRRQMLEIAGKLRGADPPAEKRRLK